MKKIKVEQEIYVASGTEMAEILGLEPRRFQQLVQQRWIEGKIGHNQYDVGLCVRHYRDYCSLPKHR
nr:hypothetical protein [Brucella anthropi]